MNEYVLWMLRHIHICDLTAKSEKNFEQLEIFLEIISQTFRFKFAVKKIF